MVIASRNAERLEAAAKELNAKGVQQIVPIPCNIRKEDEVK